MDGPGPFQPLLEYADLIEPVRRVLGSTTVEGTDWQVQTLTGGGSAWPVGHIPRRRQRAGPEHEHPLDTGPHDHGHAHQGWLDPFAISRTPPVTGHLD